MRKAVRDDGMPATIYQKNGGPIMQEEFADNAFAYVSSSCNQAHGWMVGTQTAAAPCCMRP